MTRAHVHAPGLPTAAAAELRSRRTRCSCSVSPANRATWLPTPNPAWPPARRGHARPERPAAAARSGRGRGPAFSSAAPASGEPPPSWPDSPIPSGNPAAGPRWLRRSSRPAPRPARLRAPRAARAPRPRAHAGLRASGAEWRVRCP